MIKQLKKILYFLSAFLIYFIGKEFIILFNNIYNLHPVAGYTFLAAVLSATIFFVIVPIVKILRMNKIAPPVKIETEVEALKTKRIEAFSGNSLIKNRADLTNPTNNDYEKLVAVFKPEVDQIRQRYVRSIFYATAVSQNGFLDAFLFLTSSVNMVKDIFILYNGRVSNSDLLAIARKVYMASAIAGTEGVEYATSEIFSKFATDSLKSIPFLDKLTGSLADGFVNAALLTRISFITENYCTKLLIKKDSQLAPAHKIIIDTTKSILGDVSQKITKSLGAHVVNQGQKIGDFIKTSLNPVKYLLDETDEIKEKPDNHKSSGFFNQFFRK